MCKERKSTCSICVGGPGRLPAPSPGSVVGAARGGGGGGPGLAWGFCAGKGGSLASEFGGLFSRVDLADFHGKTFWRVILADLFGGSFWHIYLAGFHK